MVNSIQDPICYFESENIFFSCVSFSKKVKGIQGTQNGLKLGLLEKWLVVNSIQDPICYFWSESFFLLSTFSKKSNRYTGHSEWLKIGTIQKIIGGKEYTGSYLLFWIRKYIFFSCIPFSKKVKGIQGTQNGLKLGLFE